MKIKVGDVVVRKGDLKRVRKIDKEGVWTGRVSNPAWWDCHEPAGMVFIYRRPKKRKEPRDGK